jgi:hypothetical protein
MRRADCPRLEGIADREGRFRKYRMTTSYLVEERQRLG